MDRRRCRAGVRTPVTFRTEAREYRGESAVEVVQALERDCSGYPEHGAPLCRFLAWSLAQLADTIPSRELLLSPRLNDETLALWYLSLCDEYGVGSLSLLGREVEANR